MIAFVIMMLSIVDLFFFPAVCILDMLLCIALFWIFFTISYAVDTVFLMKIPLWLSFFSFDPPPLYSDFIVVSLHCNGICPSSSTLLNIVVRLSIISSHLSFSHSAFHRDLSSDLLFFILRIAFFTSSCVIFSFQHYVHHLQFFEIHVHILSYFFFL